MYLNGRSLSSTITCSLANRETSPVRTHARITGFGYKPCWQVSGLSGACTGVLLSPQGSQTRAALLELLQQSIPCCNIPSQLPPNPRCPHCMVPTDMPIGHSHGMAASTCAHMRVIAFAFSRPDIWPVMSCTSKTSPHPYIKAVSVVGFVPLHFEKKLPLTLPAYPLEGTDWWWGHIALSGDATTVLGP